MGNPVDRSPRNRQLKIRIIAVLAVVISVLLVIVIVLQLNNNKAALRSGVVIPEEKSAAAPVAGAVPTELLVANVSVDDVQENEKAEDSRIGDPGNSLSATTSSGENRMDGTVGTDGVDNSSANSSVQNGSQYKQRADAEGQAVIVQGAEPNEYLVFLPSGRETVTLAFGGDVQFAEGFAILASIRRNGGIEGTIDPGMLNEMRSADLCMINNECPYTMRGAPLEGKTWTFHADPATIAYLPQMGVDLVSIANNHVFDYGEIGMMDTLTSLEQAGMPFAGAGRNLEDASRPLYFTTDTGIRLAYICANDIEGAEPPFTRGATDSLCGVFRTRKDELLCQRIAEAKATGAFVIVYMHWGIENTIELNWLQKQQANDISNAGADLIIGDHPHILQELSYVNGVPVIFSLGNFFFNSKTMDTGLVTAEFTRDGLSTWKFVPGIQKGSTLSLAYGSEYDRIISYMQSISSNVQIASDGTVTPR